MEKNDMLNKIMLDYKDDYKDLKIDLVYYGYITDIEDDIYHVNLESLHDSEELTAELFKTSFPSPDLSLGTIFFWFIGENDKGEGDSKIVMSKYTWTQEMIDKAHKEAEELYKKFIEPNQAE